MDIYFPMAGQGARFGHTFKPFLEVGGRTFIEAAVEPFLTFTPSISRFIFVYLETQEREFGVQARLEKMFAGLPVETVRLETTTRGPAETISRAVQSRGGSGPAFVCDCDHALDVAPLFDIVRTGERYDAVLPVWPLEGEKLTSWSVAMVEHDRVHAIAEKQMPSGDRGTGMGVIGCYGFRDIAQTAARARALSATNFSDVLQELLSDDKIVLAARIQRATFFGDPERLAQAMKRDAV